jgi:molecular chaperone GrpE (heat shock protein)
MTDESCEQTAINSVPPAGDWAARPAEGETPPAPPSAEAVEEQNAEGGVSESVAVARIETAMAAGFTAVAREIEAKLALDRFREDQIARLHDELMGYRSDALREPVRQVLRGVIRLHDNVGKAADALAARPVAELTPERFLRQLADVRDDFELLLEEHGVQPFTTVGEQLDPRRQTALRTVETSDRGRAGKVAASLRPGFAQGESILQKERVAVYVAPPGGNEQAKGDSHER